MATPAPAPEAALIGAKITSLLLITFIHVIVVWDIYAGSRWGYAATVSWTCYVWISRFPIIILVIGALLGHICWPLRPIFQDPPAAP